jgi:hypothetical protein
MTAGVSRAHPARQIAAPLPAAGSANRGCRRPEGPPGGAARPTARRAAIPWSTCAHTATPAQA